MSFSTFVINTNKNLENFCHPKKTKETVVENDKDEKLNEALINNVSGKAYVFKSSMSKEERAAKFKAMIGE